MPRTGAGRNLYRRGGIYWARVQIAGKDVRRSLRTSNRTEAVKRLQDILSDADRMRYGEAPRIKYADVVKLWAESGFGGLKPGTIKRYQCSLRQLHDTFSGLYLDQVTKRKIGEYVTLRSRAKATNATIRRDLTALSSLLTYAGGMGWLEDNPAKDWNRDIIKERKKPFIRPDQRDIDITIEVTNGNFAALLQFLLQTGLRLQEAARLKRSSVDWKTGTITLLHTKTLTLRTLQISPEALETIKALPRHLNSPYLFWSDRSERFKYGSRRMQDLRIAAHKLAQSRGWNYRPFRIHDLRHEYAIRYLKNGGYIYDLQQKLGHTSISVTERYLAHLSQEEQQVAKRVHGTYPGT